MDEVARLKGQLINLRQGVRAGTPLPHKPLLVLLLLHRYWRSGSLVTSYFDVENDLTILIARYAPPTPNARAFYPFWRLRKDGFWCIEGEKVLLPQQSSSGDIAPNFLTSQHPGCWSDSSARALRAAGAQSLSELVLNRYFEKSERDVLRSYLPIG